MRYDVQKKIISEKQDLLTSANICVVGMGALGSVVAELAVRAGVGNIILIDYDIVNIQNLHRQFYGEQDIGKIKVIAMQSHLESINKAVKVKHIVQSMDPDTVHTLKELNPTIIIECTDNLRTKTLLSDFAQKENLPIVIGTAAGKSGYAFGVHDNLSGIRGVFPLADPQKYVGDDCTRLGVLNTTTTIIGALQWQLAFDFIISSVMDSQVYHLHENKITSLQRKEVESVDFDKVWTIQQQPEMRKLCGNDAFMVKRKNNLDNFRKKEGMIDLGSALRHENYILLEDRIIIYAQSEEECKAILSNLEKNE